MDLILGEISLGEYAQLREALQKLLDQRRSELVKQLERWIRVAEMLAMLGAGEL